MDALGPMVAGAWYPGDEQRLAQEVDRLLAGVPVSTERPPAPDGARVGALIVPHAGYIYSGSVAAHGFAHTARAGTRRVILLGPSHRAAFQGAALPSAAAYRTPLGEVPLDLEALARIAHRPGVRFHDPPFLGEHSLEAEIPFLQRCLDPGWLLVPLLIGAGSSGDPARRVAEALGPLLGPQTLVVVSSDLTHFGPRFGFVPFEQEVPRRIRELDLGAVEPILRRDADDFASYLERTGATICGRDAIEVLLRLPLEGWQGTLARYDTSGQITGDWSHSVSYASLVFHDRAKPDPATWTS